MPFWNKSFIEKNVVVVNLTIHVIKDGIVNHLLFIYVYKKTQIGT